MKGTKIKRRRPKDPSISRIVAASSELLYKVDLDGGKPSETCWACGGHGPIQRAHVLGYFAGGSNDPGNYFLLCESCHREQPDTLPRNAQVLWLLAHESSSTRSFRDVKAACDAVIPVMCRKGKSVSEVASYLDSIIPTGGAVGAMWVALAWLDTFPDAEPLGA